MNDSDPYSTSDSVLVTIPAFHGSLTNTLQTSLWHDIRFNVIAKQDLETLDLYSHERIRFFAFSHRPSVTSLTKASVHRSAVAFTLTLEAARPAGDARTQFFSHLCPHPVPLVLKKWPWPWCEMESRSIIIHCQGLGLQCL